MQKLSREEFGKKVIDLYMNTNASKEMTEAKEKFSQSDDAKEYIDESYEAYERCMDNAKEKDADWTIKACVSCLCMEV